MEELMKPQLFSVQDKIIIITGGLGQLGRQFSKTLEENGAKVVIFDNKKPSEVAGERNQENYLYLAVDVTDKDSIEKAVDIIKTKWGIPDGLINNAALDSPPGASAAENGPFETYPEQSFEKIMDVNVKGVFLMSQVVGGAMAEAGRGSIVNINSIYGLVSPDQNIYEYRRKNGDVFYKPVAYSVSKSALLNLTRYLSTYWGTKNVRVNTLTFGGVFNNQDEQFLKAYCPKVPLGRMAHEDEYNGAVIFLMSEASSYMTGSNLVIDGGWTAW
jgi:NAD(P)-dependent dehydrogenase (short-subunit alcohol dehydrogenase family)